MDMNNEAIVAVIVNSGQWIADSANAIFMAQWASAASAAQNELERAEYEKIAESMQYSLDQDGSTIKLKSQEKDVSPYLSVIENGMDAPLSGGRNGTVTNPDGSVRPTNVPQALWGTPLPEYAKEPNPVTDGIKQMLKSLVPQWIRETVSGAKTEIAQIIKPRIAKELQAALNS